MDSLARAFSESDRMYHAAKAASGSAPSMLTGNMPNMLGMRQDNLGKHSEQYRHFRGWAYVAIRAIASRIAGQDIFVGRVASKPKTGRKLSLPNSLKSIGDRLEPMDNHWLIDAIDNPNPIMVRWSLMFSTVASMMLTGRGYWWFNDAGDKLQVWPIPAHWMKPGDPFRGTWLLRPFGGIEEHEIDGADVAAFMLPDPSNPFSSVSPLQSQAHAVSTDEAIQQSQHDAFKHGITPQLAFRIGSLPGGMPGDAAHKPVLTGEQRTEIVELVKRLYSGQAGKHHPVILDGMVEGVDRIGNTVEEMGFLASGQSTKARIMQAFGVNPIITGEIQDANRAQAVVAQQQFCEQINPIVELMSQVLTCWLSQRTSERLTVWLDPCRAEDPEQKLAEWRTARASGDVTQNEFRRNVLNLVDVPGGDEFRDSLGNVIDRTTDSLPKFSLNGSHR